MAFSEQLNSRKNFHLGNTGTLTGSSRGQLTLHLLHLKPRTTITNSLIEELKKHKVDYELHEGYNDIELLLTFKAQNNGKTVVVIQTAKDAKNYSIQGYQKYFQARSQNDRTRLFAFPYPCTASNLPVLSSSQQVIESCLNFAHQTQNRIRLQSIHTIKGSVDKSDRRSSKPAIQILPYEKLWYHRDGAADEPISKSLSYVAIVQALEGLSDGTRSIGGFRALRDLQVEKVHETDKNVLLLTSTSRNALNLVAKIKDFNNRKIHFILIGELQPTQQYLDQNILLVTNDNHKVIDCLLKNGFDHPVIRDFHKTTAQLEQTSLNSSRFRNSLRNYMKQSGSSSSGSMYFGTKRGISNIKQKPVHHWMVDKAQPKSKQFAIFEIVSSQLQGQQSSGKRKIKKLKHSNIEITQKIPKATLSKQTIISRESVEREARAKESLNREEITKQANIYTAKGTVDKNTIKENINQGLVTNSFSDRPVDTRYVSNTNDSTKCLINEKDRAREEVNTYKRLESVQKIKKEQMMGSQPRPSLVQNVKKEDTLRTADSNASSSKGLNSSQAQMATPYVKAEPRVQIVNQQKSYGGRELRYHHYPSNIIPEISAEYQGSERESIMRLQPQMSHRALRNMLSNFSTNQAHKNSSQASLGSHSRQAINNQRQSTVIISPSTNRTSYASPTHPVNRSQSSVHVSNYTSRISQSPSGRVNISPSANVIQIPSANIIQSPSADDSRDLSRQNNSYISINRINNNLSPNQKKNEPSIYEVGYDQWARIPKSPSSGQTDNIRHYGQSKTYGSFRQNNTENLESNTKILNEGVINDQSKSINKIQIDRQNPSISPQRTYSYGFNRTQEGFNSRNYFTSAQSAGKRQVLQSNLDKNGSLTQANKAKQRPSLETKNQLTYQNSSQKIQNRSPPTNIQNKITRVATNVVKIGSLQTVAAKNIPIYTTNDQANKAQSIYTKTGQATQPKSNFTTTGLHKNGQFYHIQAGKTDHIKKPVDEANKGISANAKQGLQTARTFQRTQTGNQVMQIGNKVKQMDKIAETRNGESHASPIQKLMPGATVPSSPRVLESNSKFNLDDYEKIHRDGVTIYRKRVAAQLPQESKIDSPDKQNFQNNSKPTLQNDRNSSRTDRKTAEILVHNQQGRIQSYGTQPRVIPVSYQSRITRETSDQTPRLEKQMPTDSHYMQLQSKINLTGQPNTSQAALQMAKNTTISSKGHLGRNVGQAFQVRETVQQIGHQGLSGQVQKKGLLQTLVVGETVGAGERMSTGAAERVSLKSTKVADSGVMRIGSSDKMKLNMRGVARKGSVTNDSNMFSRMSQLHSDGSILRRNNIRFGIRVRERVQPSMAYQRTGNVGSDRTSIVYDRTGTIDKSLTSGIYKGPQPSKKNLVNRVISGQEYIQKEKSKLLHIVTKFNSFHFLIQEELGHLKEMIGAYLATPNDRIQSFAGSEQLYQCIRPDRVDGKFDVGFIFASKKQLKLMSVSLFPEDYFMVSVEGDETLEVDEGSRKVRIGQLKHLQVAQKLIIDSKLYQYVAYRNNRKQIETLADKFMASEFILEKVQTEFTSEIIDFYYCELPRLTRLYLLCQPEQLPALLKLLAIYQELNPHFRQQSCKLICLIRDILKNDHLIMQHSNVTFISNPEDIKNYRDILRYAHHTQEDASSYLPLDHLFCHHKHSDLTNKLVHSCPGRFVGITYTRLSQVYKKMEMLSKLNERYGVRHRCYLVLHESIGNEKVPVEQFTKVFMLGKMKIAQGNIVRVLNHEELSEFLKN